MEASIKDGNIKSESLPIQWANRRRSFLTFTAFVKLLQCASKFGDDLNISANKDLVSLLDSFESMLMISGSYQ
jgi:hypothetical protein